MFIHDICITTASCFGTSALFFRAMPQKLQYNLARSLTPYGFNNPLHD